MLREDLEKQSKKIEASLLKDSKKNEKLFKSGEMDLEKYNKSLLTGNRKFEYLTNNCSLTDMVKRLLDLKEKEEKEPRLGLSLDFEVTSGTYEGDSPDTGVEISWYSVSMKDQLAKIPNLASTELRSFIVDRVFHRAKMMGTNKNWGLAVDCKLVSLFKEGKIDFDTLVTITYSDCSI